MHTRCPQYMLVQLHGCQIKAATFKQGDGTHSSMCLHPYRAVSYVECVAVSKLCMPTQVLDYQNTAADLLGGVASAYALRFMGQAGMAMYRQFEADRDRGDFSILPELHSTLSALKVGNREAPTSRPATWQEALPGVCRTPRVPCAVA